MNKKLEDSIIKTLVYFDYFDHPLTAEELFRYLWQPPIISYEDFLEELENISTSNIQTKYGFYFLKDRFDTIEIRRSKTADNDHKNLLATKAAKKVRWV